MIWLGILAFIAFIFCLFVRSGLKDKEDRGVMTIFCSVFGVASLALSISGSIATVPPGHVGVQVLFGSVQEKTLPEGLSVVNPFVSVNHMSGRTQTYTMSGTDETSNDIGAIIALSSDGLRIPMDVSIVYRLDPTYASWVLQNIGVGYEDILLKPASRTAVRQAAAKFTAQQAYSSQREQLSLRMMNALSDSIKQIFRQRGFNNDAIHIEQVLLRNVNLPDRVKNAIEEKLGAEQEAQRMTFILEKERKEAERKEIEAGGIQKFQEIVKQGIDDRLLRWKGIEATEKLALSKNAKVVVIGGSDGLPIILNADASKASASLEASK